MIEALVSWFRTRKVNVREEKFARGAEYARTCLSIMTHENAMQHLECVIDTALVFGDYDAFDEGIESVLKQLR